MRTHHIVGVSDCKVCQICDRRNVRCVQLRANDGTDEIVHVGVDCAVGLLGLQKNTTAMGQVWASAQTESRRAEGRAFGVALAENIVRDVVPRVADGGGYWWTEKRTQGISVNLVQHVVRFGDFEVGRTYSDKCSADQIMADLRKRFPMEIARKCIDVAYGTCDDSYTSAIWSVAEALKEHGVA